MSPEFAIAHYRITGKLGEGGMGTVYRATDTKLNRAVAIKVLPEEFAANPDRLARFTREAHVLASLNHPNIAAVHGVEDRALVMELAEGETLKGPLPLELALDYMGQIADALEYAHDRGVVHRDLKPANVKVTPEGVVKLLDFGLAKAMVPDSTPGDPNISPTLTMNATKMGVILGTAAYMSPEQAKGKPVDRRADIWAFGVVLWELLTGRELFAGETISDTLAHVLTREPDWNAAPASVQRLLRGCLQKDPKQRLRSIGDWRLLLEEPKAPVKAVPTGRRTWVAAGAAVIFATAAGWLWFQRAEPEPAAMFQLAIQPPDGELLYQDAVSGLQEISPDGRAVAFIAGANGTRHIWIRPLESATARAFTGTELADGLFWSPDSRHVGFTAGNKLHRVDLATGTVKEICDAGGSLRGATWNAEGTIVFGTTAGALRSVPADGGAPVPVTEYDSKTETNHNFPQFLPDNKHFLYWVRGAQPEATGVYVGSLDDKPASSEVQRHKQILASTTRALFVNLRGARTGHLLFQRGKTLFAQHFNAETFRLSGTPYAIAENVGARSVLGEFSASSTGILTTSPAGSLFRTLTVMSRTGAVIRTIGQPDAYTALRLSPDGRSVAVVKSGADSALHIWLMDMTNGTSVRFTQEGAVNVFPNWSPDGKEIFYSSNRGNHYQLYRRPIGGKEQLIETDPAGLASQWIINPPGLVYFKRATLPELSVGLVMLPLIPGSSPMTLVEQAKSLRISGNISPSGRWLAYVTDESGVPEVYVRSMPAGSQPPGPPVRISVGGGADPMWSADGRTLFFNTPDDRLMSCKVTVAGERFGREEPSFLFSLGGTSSYNGGTYWQPLGNGEQFLVLRSAPVTARDNVINVLINWERTLPGQAHH